MIAALFALLWPAGIVPLPPPEAPAQGPADEPEGFVCIYPPLTWAAEE